MMKEAIEEVERFCDEHSWLTEIHAFVAQWQEKDLLSWRGQPTPKIEVQHWFCWCLQLDLNLFLSKRIFKLKFFVLYVKRGKTL